MDRSHVPLRCLDFSFHVIWEPVLLHVVWSLHVLQNPEKVCFCLPTYLNGSHLFTPVLCPKWGDVHGPSLLGGGFVFLVPLQAQLSDRIERNFDFVRLSGFVLLWWKHFFFFFAAFCMWSRSKKLLDSYWEEGDSVLNSVIYDLWSLLSHCFLSCKVGIIIKVVIIITIDLSVQWKAIWRIIVKTHGKALINQKLL